MSMENNIVEDYLNLLSEQCNLTAKENNWKSDWSEGGCYLHLESSEFIESLRGKAGTPEFEAADILFMLLSMCHEYNVNIKIILKELENIILHRGNNINNLTIVNSAIRHRDFPDIIITGKRHPDCFNKFKNFFPDKELKNEILHIQQGFITNNGDFINRQMAAKVALMSGQILKIPNNGELTSEDIFN